jgi:hypothetical protein
MSIMGFEPFRDFDRLPSQLASGRQVPHGVALDAWRSGDAYRVALELPGVDPERIELICERNGLTIRAERAADYGEQDEVLSAGRPVGSPATATAPWPHWGLRSSASQSAYRVNTSAPSGAIATGAIVRSC